MTFSEFETRLNYYFNSTSEQDIYAIEDIFDGEVYPTMTAEEKKTLYNDLIPQYSEIYTSYTLIKMLKNYNPEAFVETCHEIPKEEQLTSNFIYVIFFDDAIF